MVIETCETSVKEIIYTLQTKKALTRATCAGSRVTIRPMSLPGGVDDQNYCILAFVEEESILWIDSEFITMEVDG